MNQKNSILLSGLSVFVMFALYFGTELGHFGDNPVGQTSSYNEPLVVPQGYAFAIWGVIYLGLLILPIYHWFRRKEGHGEWLHFRKWFSINVVLNGLWLACASLDCLWSTVFIIILMLITLYQMRLSMARLQLNGVTLHYWIEEFLVHIYFAWITLATALNISAALQFYEWNRFGQSELFWSVLILPVAAIIAAKVFLTFRDRAYAAVVIWAFVAIVVKHLGIQDIIAYLSIAVVVIFSFLILRSYNQSKLSLKN